MLSAGKLCKGIRAISRIGPLPRQGADIGSYRAADLETDPQPVACDASPHRRNGLGDILRLDYLDRCSACSRRHQRPRQVAPSHGDFRS